eukprot:3711642-Amphidinium_carterae.1
MTVRSRGEAIAPKPMALAQPAALLGLTYLEKRLISFMRVNEFLIDLPTSKAPGQFGRVYVCPVDEPDAVAVLKELNAASVRDGVIYVIPPSGQGATALPVRPAKLLAALEYLSTHNEHYTRGT